MSRARQMATRPSRGLPHAGESLHRRSSSPGARLSRGLRCRRPSGVIVKPAAVWLVRRLAQHAATHSVVLGIEWERDIPSRLQRLKKR